jgi:hypothetical protein
MLIICTIAVGDEYYNNFKIFIEDFNRLNLDVNFIVVTDKEKIDFDNVKTFSLTENDIPFVNIGYRKEFNFNLKYLPLKYAAEQDSNFVFFVDSDWKINKEITRQKIFNFLNFFGDSNYDFLFERSLPIKNAKTNLNSFWSHKVKLYDLNQTDEYDEGHVANEQFLCFKNNEKLKTFVKFWEEKNEICLSNNVRPWCEGVEIGMSSAKAKMKISPYKFKEMENCFSFQSKSGKIYQKF